jgi:DNA modification methylase
VTLPKPHTTLETSRCTLRFDQADCLEVFAALSPASVSVVVTSPPYNLGIRYRTYETPFRGPVIWSGRASGSARPRLAIDPFLGLGSSAVAAAELGIDFIGVEMDAHYLKEAVARARAAVSSLGLEQPALGIQH